MSEYEKTWLICAFLMAVAAYLSVDAVNRRSHRATWLYGKLKYSSFSNVLILPIYLCTVFSMDVLLDGWGRAAEEFLISGFGILLSMTLYYICLIPALPVSPAARRVQPARHAVHVPRVLPAAPAPPAEGTAARLSSTDPTSTANTTRTILSIMWRVTTLWLSRTA